MQSIVLNEPGQLRRRDTEEPLLPGPGEVLIRIQRIGVCGTDFHAFLGEQPFFSYPRILGHELGVEVVALGEQVETLAPGMRCAVEPYFYCGTCSACRRGKPNCCLNLKVFGVHIDGGMREYAIIPAKYLHPAKTLSFDQLALVEPLSIGAHAVSRAQITPGEQVLVIGAGPIGLAVTQFALLMDANVTVIDISESRLAFCQQLWPQVTCLLNKGNPLDLLTSDDLPSVVFDATGNKQSMQGAFQLVGQGGKLIFVGLFQGDVTFHDPDFHRRELTLLSSRNAVSADFQRIISYMEHGQIQSSPWITHRSNFADLNDAFPLWLKRDSGVIKAMISL
jgi:2-desacetyl-2-hydroxyethyl bacteriochlorophyllide A dehydrogenase